MLENLMQNNHNARFLELNRCDDNWLIQIIKFHPGWTIHSESEEAIQFVRVDASNTLGSPSLAGVRL